jgi:flavodoxin
MDVRQELNEIFGRENIIDQLPEVIKNDLINVIYPNRYQRKKFNISDITATNKSAINMSSDPDDQKWTNRNKQIINKLKLVGIMSYGNGDYAWYSLVNGKVYDTNHDLGDFSAFLSKENSGQKNKVWPPLTYKQWRQSVLSNKHIDGWKRG